MPVVGTTRTPLAEAVTSRSGMTRLPRSGLETLGDAVNKKVSFNVLLFSVIEMVAFGEAPINGTDEGNRLQPVRRGISISANNSTGTITVATINKASRLLLLLRARPLFFITDVITGGEDVVLLCALAALGRFILLSCGSATVADKGIERRR